MRRLRLPLAPWLWLAAVMLVAIPLRKVAAADKTPAQWVAQLGAEHLPEREEAGAALLSLGAKARADVRAALDSPDPEIKARAAALWETLRWDVIPGAEADTAKFFPSATDSQDSSALWRESNKKSGLWREFNKKYGLQGIQLMAEFHAAGMEQTSYQTGLLLLLTNTPAEKVTAFIKETDPETRKSCENLLGVFRPGENGLQFAAILVNIQTGMGNYKAAFEHARDAATRDPVVIPDYDKLVALCATAVQQGGIFDEVQKEATREMTEETDPDRICAKLGFYATLLTKMSKQTTIAPLCDIVAGKTDRADARHMRRLVESLVAAGMPDYASKMLQGADSPLAIYMRSNLEQKAGDKAAADADWKKACKATLIGKNEIQKSLNLELADLMKDWHDPRAGEIYEKVLSIAEAKTGYDVEACFHMGAMMEDQHNYARAVEFYEKGLGISQGLGSEYFTSTPDGKGVVLMYFSDEAPAIRRKVYGLKSRLTEQTPIPAPAGQ